MRYLKERGLDKVILSLTQPVLGICIGQQLMCRHSEEGNVDCLGIFDADVKRFVPVKHEDKIPHMGWNSLSIAKEDDEKSPFSRDLEGLFVYFVHSFYVPVCKHTALVTDYIHPFSAAMHKDNFYATQFHPEKSGKVGQQILKNFLEL
jgi:glutamine amidotransferase